MRKRQDPPSQRNDPGLREVPASAEQAEGVVRLGVDSESGEEELSMPEVERLPVDRMRPEPRRAAMMEMELGRRSRVLKEEVVAEDLDAAWAEEGTGVRVPMGWVMLLVALAVGVVLFAVVQIPRGDVTMDERVGEVTGKLGDLRVDGEEATRFAEQVESVARAYLAAETVEEKLKYVRMSERVRPLMEAHYKTHPLVPQEAAGFYTFEPIALENYSFLVMTIKLIGGGQEVLMLEEDEKGKVWVDWESEVAYMPMSLDEFVQRKPSEALDFRVRVAYDQFYAFEFGDQKQYVSLFLSERDEPGFLFGYVKRGSEEHKKIVEQLGEDEEGDPQERQVAPMILRVRFLPKSKGLRSVLVEKVVAPRWAIVEQKGAE